MTTVTFYEKPGCINNTKQKTLLKAAGHTVNAHSLLEEPWTAERLRPFFGSLPVGEWFNRTAPAIKSGQVHPEQLDEETALALMLQDPLLIRRPLMQVGEQYGVGFDVQQVDQWIGLKAASELQRNQRDALIHQDLQTCPNNTNSGARIK